MTSTEIKAGVAQLVAAMRVVMPRASDREIYDTVAEAIRPPRNVDAQSAKNYGLARVALADIAGDATYRRRA